MRFRFLGVYAARLHQNSIIGLIAGLLLLACACEPTATPLPVNLPTQPPPTLPAGSALATTPAPLRYAIAPGALPYLSDRDRSLISASAQLVPLDAAPAPDDLGTRYEIVVALGDLPDGTRAPSPLQVSLIVNTALSPLDNPALVEILRRAIDPAKIAAALALPGQSAATLEPADPPALRVDLANAGYPDGFDLTLAAPVSPAADVLSQLLAPLGIHIRLTTTPGEVVHLILTTDEATTPAANAIPLFTVPISYRTVDGLTITFTPSGFPLVQR